MEQGRLHFPVIQVLTIRVHHDDIAKQHVHIRVRLEKLLHALKRAGKILFIAVKVGKDVTGGAAETAIDGVVQQPPVTFGGFCRPQDLDVGRGFELPVYLLK